MAECDQSVVHIDVSHAKIKESVGVDVWIECDDVELQIHQLSQKESKEKPIGRNAPIKQTNTMSCYVASQKGKEYTVYVYIKKCAPMPPGATMLVTLFQDGKKIDACSMCNMKKGSGQTFCHPPQPKFGARVPTDTKLDSLGNGDEGTIRVLFQAAKFVEEISKTSEGRGKKGPVR